MDLESDSKVLDIFKMLEDAGIAMEPPKTIRYDVIVTRANSDEVVFHYLDIAPQYAGRLRNEYRNKHGYRVSLFQTGVSGEIHREPEVVIEKPKRINIGHGMTVANRRRVTEREVNYLRRKNQELLRKENARLERSNKDRTIRVYDKVSSKLSFAGTIEEAVKHIQYMINAGIWNDTSWVIYLPKKIYDKVVQ